MSQGPTLHLAEGFRRVEAMSQGTTLVVPQTPQYLPGLQPLQILTQQKLYLF
jgi:hypothetical protein